MTALTNEDIERQYENGVHIGSGLPRATCPCGFCQKYREPKMNQAYAIYLVINPTRALVDIEYKFLDGRRNHAGFSTVDVGDPATLYDACYGRAEALANFQGCRLETFKLGDPMFRVHLTNFNYFAPDDFRSMTEARAYATRAGFECTIQRSGNIVGTYSPITGYKSV